MPDIGDRDRIGNMTVNPSTGELLAAPPTPFTTGGEAVDPTEVTLTVQPPIGAPLVFGWPAAGADGSLTRESAGRFYAEVTYDVAGTWTYRLAGTGAVVAAEEGSVRVMHSALVD